MMTALFMSGAGARGADEKHAAPATGKAQHGEKSDAQAAPGGGLPPFLQPALDLTIWTIVVFLVLLFLLSKLAWKPMMEGLEKRERAIAAAVEESHRARAEAAQLRREIQEEHQKAAERIREALDEARRDAQRLKDEMIAQAKTEIQTERDRLYREIGIARDQALHDLWQQTAQLATLISSKAIRRSLTPEDHRALVDEALNEMGPAIADRRRTVGSVQA
jgi:F-type H+-transporting ATPase subunit b